jgi:hypothetical protein
MTGSSTPFPSENLTGFPKLIEMLLKLSIVKFSITLSICSSSSSRHSVTCALIKPYCTGLNCMRIFSMIACCCSSIKRVSCNLFCCNAVLCIGGWVNVYCKDKKEDATGIAIKNNRYYPLFISNNRSFKTIAIPLSTIFGISFKAASILVCMATVSFFNFNNMASVAYSWAVGNMGDGLYLA